MLFWFLKKSSSVVLAWHAQSGIKSFFHQLILGSLSTFRASTPCTANIKLLYCQICLSLTSVPKITDYKENAIPGCFPIIPNQEDHDVVIWYDGTSYHVWFITSEFIVIKSPTLVNNYLPAGQYQWTICHWIAGNEDVNALYSRQ